MPQRLHGGCVPPASAGTDGAAQPSDVDSAGQWGVQTCPVLTWFHRTRVFGPKGLAHQMMSGLNKEDLTACSCW